MKKRIASIILILTFCAFMSKEAFSMANPWIECNDDFSCASEKAGFNFPLKVKNPSLRAMDGMFEITFNLDKKRIVTARKTLTYEGTDDISGDYNNYPVNKTITLKNGVIFNVRGERDKFYVANMAAETGYYSFYCKKGLKPDDLNRLYLYLVDAEAPKE